MDGGSGSGSARSATSSADERGADDDEGQAAGDHGARSVPLEHGLGRPVAAGSAVRSITVVAGLAATRRRAIQRPKGGPWRQVRMSTSASTPSRIWTATMA